MRKIATLLLLVVCTLISTYAVPRGSYYDSKGRLKVLVSDNGQIHVLDRNGDVINSSEVIQENEDGSFVRRVVAVKGYPYNGPTYYQNAYFYDKNGNLCLNLQDVYETVIRK